MSDLADRLSRSRPSADGEHVRSTSPELWDEDEVLVVIKVDNRDLDLIKVRRLSTRCDATYPRPVSAWALLLSYPHLSAVMSVPVSV